MIAEQTQAEVTADLAAPEESAPEREGVLRRVAAAAVPYVAGVATAMSMAAIFLLAIGADPLLALHDIIVTSLGSQAALAETVQRTTPLVLGAGAVAFGMRAGLINLGVDGQIYAGAIAAVGVGYALGPTLARPLTLFVLLVVGALAGALLASIAAVLKVTRGVNEVFVTVMLNFIALYLASWLAAGPWQDEISGEALSRPLAANARLPAVLFGSSNIGIFLAIPLVVLLYLWLSRTRRGFEQEVAGINMRAARFGGVNLASVGITGLVVGGTLGGLAGSIEVTGVYGRLIIGISPGFGLSSILIAVLARRHLLAVIPVAFLFAALVVGSDSLERSVRLPASAGLLFQGVMVLSILFFAAGQRRSWFRRARRKGRT